MKLTPPRQSPGFRSGLARLIVLPLVAQLLYFGCQWVPIEPDFALDTTRRLGPVRIDGKTVVEEVSITDFIVTADQATYKKVTIDVTASPASVQIPESAAAAITKGQTRQVEQVRVGDSILRDATITWPMITGYKQTYLTADLRRQLVERQALSPGGKIGIALGVIIPAAVGLIFLGVVITAAHAEHG